MCKHFHTPVCILSYIQVQRFPPLRQPSKGTGIQGSLFGSDIKRYTGICLGDALFTHKQCITNTSLVINSSYLNCEHCSIINTRTYMHICTYTSLTHRKTYVVLYGVVPKGLSTFLGIFFLCNAEFSPCWALPEYIRALIHLACLRVFSVTPWVIVYRLYRVR